MATVIPYQTEIVAAAKAENIDPALLAGLIKQESGFNPNARSPAGALGIAQFMPKTAAGYGIDPLNPLQAIPAAARYLASSLRRYGGDVAKTLASYNAGVGAVDKYNGVPPYPETRHYVDVVQKNAADYRAGGLTAAAGALGTASAAPTATADTPAVDAGDVQDRWSGAGVFAPIFRGIFTGAIYGALILGGAVLIVLGTGRAMGGVR